MQQKITTNTPKTPAPLIELKISDDTDEKTKVFLKDFTNQATSLFEAATVKETEHEPKTQERQTLDATFNSFVLGVLNAIETSANRYSAQNKIMVAASTFWYNKNVQFGRVTNK